MQARHLGVAAAAALALSATRADAAYAWKSVQIWGGGYVPGVSFHPKAGGPVYARTDVGGAYRLDPRTGTSWIPLNDMFTDGNDMGSIAIGLDPDDTNYVYLTGGLYTALTWGGGGSFLRSADRGATWTRISLKANTNVSGANLSMVKTGDSTIALGGNGMARGSGPRIAAKGTTLYLATNQNGLLRSTDRGATWTTVTAAGDSVGSVVIDAAGNVYAASYAGGIWKSTNGTNWTQLPGFTATAFQMCYSKTDNKIWITANATNPMDQNQAGGGSVWTYDATAQTFAQVVLPAKGGKDYGYGGVSVNPSNSRQVLVSTMGWWKGSGGPASGANFVPHEAIFLTLDGGATWKDILATGSFDAASAKSSATSNPHWITALAVDPADSNHVVFGTGYGVWSTRSATASVPTWTFADSGIEETVPLALTSSSYGSPLLSAVGDVDGYDHLHLDAPPTSRHQPEAGTNFDLSFAGQAPSKMIRIYKESAKGLNLGAYSNDGGHTWTPFGSHPPFVVSIYDTCSNGCDNSYSNESNYAAISADGKAIVWNLQTYGVYYSLDSGATWKASTTDTSLLTSPIAGLRVVADRVTPGTFYIYNGLKGILYRSTNSGATWTAMNSTLQYDDDWALGYFRAFASPKQAGELWITQAAHFYTCTSCAWSPSYAAGLWVGKGSTSNIVYRSTDGGKTVTAVNGLLMATYVGFGKGKTTGIPSVYVVGVNASGIKGLFRSDDDGATWTRVDDAAHQYGGISMVVGDPCVYSRVYVSGGGARGILYGEDGTNANSCPDRLDGGAAGVAGRKVGAVASLVRTGSFLVSPAPIQLYALDGRMVRSVQTVDGRATLSLRGLQGGLYIARSAGEVLKTSVQR
jgi:hypothetical protein